MKSKLTLLAGLLMVGVARGDSDPVPQEVILPAYGRAAQVLQPQVEDPFTWATLAQAVTPATATPPPRPVGLPAPPPLPVLGTVKTLPTPPPLPESSLPKRSLDYDTAPLLALAHNPRISAVLANVRDYIARVGVTEALDRPQGLLQLQGPPVVAPNSSSSFRNDYVLSPIRLEVRKLVYDGGKILATIQRDKSLARAQGKNAQEEWLKLAYEVRQAYLNSLVTHGNVTLSQEQLTTTRESLRQAEVRFNVGKAPRGDVLSAALPVSEAEVSLAQAQEADRDAYATLNSLLGYPPNAPLDLKPPSLPDQPLPGLDVCVAEAMRQRPSILAAQENVRYGQKNIEAAQLDNHPYMNVLVGLAAQSVDTQVIGAFTYRGGFEFNWQFADGGRARSLTEMARNRAEYFGALLQQEQQKVELEVNTAYRKLLLAVSSHVGEQRRVAQARDALRIANAQYRAGVTTVYPVRQAQTDLLEARQKESKAYFDYFLALADLDRSCGRSSVPLDVPLPEQGVDDNQFR